MGSNDSFFNDTSFFSLNDFSGDLKVEIDQKEQISCGSGRSGTGILFAVPTAKASRRDEIILGSDHSILISVLAALAILRRSFNIQLLSTSVMALSPSVVHQHANLVIK